MTVFVKKFLDEGLIEFWTKIGTGIALLYEGSKDQAEKSRSMDIGVYMEIDIDAELNMGTNVGLADSGDYLIKHEGYMNEIQGPNRTLKEGDFINIAVDARDVRLT